MLRFLTPLFSTAFAATQCQICLAIDQGIGTSITRSHLSPQTPPALSKIPVSCLEYLARGADTFEGLDEM